MNDRKKERRERERQKLINKKKWKKEERRKRKKERMKSKGHIKQMEAKKDSKVRSNGKKRKYWQKEIVSKDRHTKKNEIKDKSGIDMSAYLFLMLRCSVAPKIQALINFASTVLPPC